MHARFWMLILLPLMVSTASGTDIYKCTGKNGTVSYGDTPCPSQQTTLLHKETAAEAAQAKQESIANTLNGMIDNPWLPQMALPPSSKSALKPISGASKKSANKK